MNVSQTSFEATRRVRWCETDSSGFVHFANYVRYMEETEYEFLRSIGLSVVLTDERGNIGFPRRTANYEIENAARFDDELTIRMNCSVDGVSIKYQFEIVGTSNRVATGQFHVLCCRFPPGKPPYAILIPDFVMQKFACGSSSVAVKSQPEA